VVVIEHNLDIIKSADRIIDMGPEGGEEGGLTVAVGTPEEIAAEPSSHTGEFLAELVTPAASRPKPPRKARKRAPRLAAAA
jgi:excinuclease ABC subunit A